MSGRSYKSALLLNPIDQTRFRRVKQRQKREVFFLHFCAPGPNIRKQVAPSLYLNMDDGVCIFEENEIDLFFVEKIKKTVF